MIYALIGFAHAAIERRVLAIRSLAGGERGQGTVEYVGLILLVSLLMVGMVAAMQNFQSDEGSAIADTIVSKMKSAINKITFR